MSRNERPFANQSRRLIPYKYSEGDLDRAVQTEPTWLLPIYGNLFQRTDNVRVLHLMAGSGAELSISRKYFGSSAHILAADNNLSEFKEGSRLRTNAEQARCETEYIDVSYTQSYGKLAQKMGGSPHAVVLRHPKLFDSLTTLNPLPNAMTAVSRAIEAAKSWGAQMLLTLLAEPESDAVEQMLKDSGYRIRQDFKREKLLETPALHYKSETAHLDRYCKLFP